MNTVQISDGKGGKLKSFSFLSNKLKRFSEAMISVDETLAAYVSVKEQIKDAGLHSSEELDGIKSFQDDL